MKRSNPGLLDQHADGDFAVVDLQCKRIPVRHAHMACTCTCRVLRARTMIRPRAFILVLSLYMGSKKRVEITERLRITLLPLVLAGITGSRRPTVYPS